MPSPVITDHQPRQLTLDLDPSVLHAHRSLRDVVAAGVYRRGLKVVAGDLDLAPGNLSNALSDDATRKFSVDELERYMQATGDFSPIDYLVLKYRGDAAAARDQALGQVAELLQSLPALLANAGINAPAGRSRR